MKGTGTYILVSAVIFITVTNIVLYLNNKYENIWELDFTPTEVVMPVDSTVIQDSLRIADSLFVADSIRIADSTRIADSLERLAIEEEVRAELETKMKEAEQEAARKEAERRKRADIFTDVGKDTIYVKWKKNTVKLYEQMESDLVAQVIQNFSDNVARDILYSMNKEKAAEVLSLMGSRTVQRYTRVQK